MTSQRDEMTGRGAAADSRAAESEDRGSQPPLVVGGPDDTDAPDRLDARPDAPLADEDDVILARDDEPVAAEHGTAGPGDPVGPAGEDELGGSAETAVPAGRGTSVPAGGPAAAPGGPATPGERDVFGAARGVGEPATVPAPTDGAAAGAVPAGASTAGPAAAGEPAAAGGIPAAALAEQQWPQIMALFVDDPHGSVERAAAAASEVAAALTASLDREQQRLRASWRDNASTEDLRTALQQYRAFCGRLEGLG
jgi:hypothetical protein